MDMTKRKLLEDNGQALVEYALILALITVATIVVLTAVGQDINGLLARVDSAMRSALP
jgi:Flp pilus assembly pilin Flp